MKLFIILIFLLSVGVVSAADFTYNINQSEVFNHIELISILYIENKTLSIEYGNFTYSNTSSLFFNNSDTADLNINIYVPSSAVPGNYSDYVHLFNIEDNFSTLINFSINIAGNITVNNTVPTVDYIQTDFNQFEYTLCDYMMPWNRTKQVTIRGHTSQVVYTDYDAKFFNLTDNTIVIPESNYSIVNINIHLDNLTAKTYVKQVGFSVVSNYSNVSFTFVIQKCVRPSPTYDDMVRVCSIINKTAQDVLLCLQLQAKNAQDEYEAILSMQDAYIINNTVKEYVNVTERVPVLDLGDPEVVQALKDIPVTWKQMQVDQNQKDKKIQELSDEVLSFRDSYNKEMAQIRNESEKRITDSVAAALEDSAIKQNTIDMMNKSWLKKSTIYTWLAVILVIGLLIGGYMFWDANNFW